MIFPFLQQYCNCKGKTWQTIQWNGFSIRNGNDLTWTHRKISWNLSRPYCCWITKWSQLGGCLGENDAQLMRCGFMTTTKKQKMMMMIPVCIYLVYLSIFPFQTQVSSGKQVLVFDFAILLCSFSLLLKQEVEKEKKIVKICRNCDFMHMYNVHI